MLVTRVAATLGKELWSLVCSQSHPIKRFTSMWGGVLPIKIVVIMAVAVVHAEAIRVVELPISVPSMVILTRALLWLLVGGALGSTMGLILALMVEGWWAMEESAPMVVVAPRLWVDMGLKH